ncbi:hypothetical protein HYX05_00800 [Candidatus Woesearchaeota archaeon]|nr:hypothetical protein [Candidatus Woesearchaeota archaeon]
MSPREFKEWFNNMAASVAGGLVLRAVREEQKPTDGASLSRTQPAMQEPRYHASVSPAGRYVLTIDDLLVDQVLRNPTNKAVRDDYGRWLKEHLFFGSFLDSPYFKLTEEKYGKWLTEPQKEIAARIEADVQRDFKALGQRRHSGLPASSHIYSDLQESLKIALKAGVPLDYIIVIADLLHDKIEEAQKIKDLENKWLDSLLRNELGKAAEYSRQLTEGRREIAEDLEKRLNGYIPHGVRGTEREDYRKYHAKAVRIVMDATRWADINPYAYSLRHDFSRDGGEGLDQTFRRFVVKGSDLISNSYETDPILAEIMLQLRMASKDGRVIGLDGSGISYVVGEEFVKRFGNLEKDGKPMSAAMRVANSAPGVVGSQYANKTFNRYGIDVASGRENGSTPQLMRLAVYTISDLVSAKAASARSAIMMYEQYPEVQAIKSKIDELIERKRQRTFYDRITWNGFIGKWLVRDAGGRENIDPLDNDPKERIESYTHARHLADEQLQRFTMVYDRAARRKGRELIALDRPGDYDPRKHVLFTLGGFKEMMKLLPDHAEMIADYRNTGTQLSLDFKPK